MHKYTFNWIWSTTLAVMISIVVNFSWRFFFSSFSRSCGPSDTLLVGPSFLGRLFWSGVLLFTLIQTQFIESCDNYFCVLTSSKVTNPPQIVVYCIPEPVQKKQTQKPLFLLEMTHWCCCCRCNCRCFSAARQWKLFSSSCLLVERPHEEHVRNLSACIRLAAKAFLSVSMWLIDLVIVIATVDISTRFSLDRTSDHSLFQFSIDVDPPFFFAVDTILSFETQIVL